MEYHYKIASTMQEMDQIHQLNYKTFVEEIPQHAADASRMRVDRYHNENTYLIGKDGEQLIAMLAIRSNRPFSLDEKLPSNLASYLPHLPKKLVEIRLLAVEKHYRNKQVFYGLADYLKAYLWGNEIDMAVISGTTLQQRLYRRLGFIPFGPEVGTGEARFQPMYMTRESFEASETAALFPDTAPVSFYAGPVAVDANVTEALATPPISHRSRAFVEQSYRVRTLLKQMTRAEDVQIMLGSGTLANDIVAAQLQSLRAHGLILINGEFGRRLADHASRMQLSYDTYIVDDGQPFDVGNLDALAAAKPYVWMWAVHSETSTGMLNDIAILQHLCRQHDMRLCLDCISSIGAVKLDLSNVYLASGASGKALGGYTGIAIVWHNYSPIANPHLPRYLDLGLYAAANSLPYSQSSNLINALHTALLAYHTDGIDRYAQIRQTYRYMIEQLQSFGIPPLVEHTHASPIIITIALPATVSSRKIGDELALRGYLTQYESVYLLERNYLQLATVNVALQDAARMIGTLASILQAHDVVDASLYK